MITVIIIKENYKRGRIFHVGILWMGIPRGKFSKWGV